MKSKSIFPISDMNEPPIVLDDEVLVQAGPSQQEPVLAQLPVQEEPGKLRRPVEETNFNNSVWFNYQYFEKTDEKSLVRFVSIWFINS